MSIQLQPAQGYIKYVIEHLNSNPSFIVSKGFNNVNSLLRQERNFKKFSNIEAVYKKFYKALSQKTMPNTETLVELQNAFEIPMSFEDFRDELDRKNQQFTKYLQSNFTVINSTTSLFTKIPKELIIPESAEDFYNGFPPTWGHIAGNFDVERTDYIKEGGLKEKTFDLIKNLSNLQIYFITGVAGTGKTTLLKRLAFDVSKSIGNTFYVDLELEDENTIRLFESEVKSILSGTHKKTVFFVHSLYDAVKLNYLQNLKSIFHKIQNTPVLFVIAEHSSYVKELSLNYFHAFSSSISKINLSVLDDLEIEKFFTKIQELEDLGIISKIPRELDSDGVKELCKTAFGRQLVVALLQIRKGQKFSAIIKNECRVLEKLDLSYFSLNAYYLVCIFNYFDLNIYDDLVFNCLGKNWNEGNLLLDKYCSQIIIFKNNTLFPRNKIIGNEIRKYALQNYPNVVRKIFFKCFSVFCEEINPSIEIQSFLLQFFSTPNLQKKLKTIFIDDIEEIRRFYQTFQSTLLKNKAFRSVYLISFGIFEKNNNNYHFAVLHFENALKLKINLGFIYKMFAYIYLNKLEWDKSADYALLAYEKCTTDETKCEAAEILSYNRYENFLKAEPLFKKLKASKNQKVKEECKKYQKCLEEIKKYDTTDNLTIRKHILEKIRPKLNHLRHFIVSATQNYKIDFLKALSINNGNQFSLEELSNLQSEIDLIEDDKVRATFYRILGNSMRVEYLRLKLPVEANAIEELFLKSIALNQEDSFTHNLYGTFLKDIKLDFAKAEKEYRLAIKIGEESKIVFYVRNPKFLNDLALLIIKQVETGLKNLESLYEAKILLEEATAKVELTEDNSFVHAKKNLNMVNEMIQKLQTY
jgi:hypothetical protein